MTKIGLNIKKIRQTKGLSQQSFAELLGISRGNISSYEENRAEPKIETIISIANYFSITLEDLLTKELSINEILQYNADKLLEDEQRLASYKLKEIPFINDDVLARVWHNEHDFSEVDDFPKICLPVTSFADMLAVSFNENIPHHLAFEQFKALDVLLFKALNTDNAHLTEQRLGLFVFENRIKMGMFTRIDGEIQLQINPDNCLVVTDLTKFWLLNGYYNANFYS